MHDMKYDSNRFVSYGIFSSFSHNCKKWLGKVLLWGDNLWNQLFPEFYILGEDPNVPLTVVQIAVNIKIISIYSEYDKI